MLAGKGVMWCRTNSNKFATWPKYSPDPFIYYTYQNSLKSGFAKKSWVYYFWYKALSMELDGP